MNQLVAFINLGAWVVGTFILCTELGFFGLGIGLLVWANAADF